MSATQMAAVAAGMSDTATSEAVAARMGGTIDRPARVPTTSIGHRTGLFDQMATMGPSGGARFAPRVG